MALIEARGVRHSYNGRDEVLRGIDLDIEAGSFVSVLGASGSGKTTLLSILGGIERPTFRQNSPPSEYNRLSITGHFRENPPCISRAARV